MLSCGVVCAPQEVQRVTRTFVSNSRPARVLTDAGPGYVKGIGSPAGPDSLAAELIAAELATMMGLKVPPFSIIRDPQIDLPMEGMPTCMGPPLFFSQEVDAQGIDGSDKFLKHLDRPGDIAKLVVFDTWVRNSDRYAGGFGQEQLSNRDNVLIGRLPSGRYGLYPIDHATCFTISSFEDGLSGPEALADEEVYGLFPEFRPYLTPDLAADAISAMAAISPDTVSEVVNSVPAEWGMTRQIKDLLVDLIVGRAERVAHYAPIKLVDEPKLGLAGRAP